MTTPPRRVLMTVDAVGGVWRYALDLASGLAGRGVEIVLAGSGPEPSAAQKREAGALGDLVWLPDPLDWLAGGPAELSGLPRRLARLARERRIDLMHLNLPSQAASLDSGCPVVTVSHSCVVTWFRAVRGEECPPGWAWQEKLNREGFAAADAVVAPSRSHARLLEASYGPIRGLSVVHNAASPRETDAPEEPFVFAAGRWWDEGKNGRLLDEAAPDLSWPVRVAGSARGPNGQFLALRHVEALGELPHAAVRDLAARAGIFASPSLYEPFGLAALEAAIAGAPLVLSDIPTYRELWDGAAVFADGRDPAAFRTALETLIADEALRRNMGRRAAERARQFSPDRQLDAMLDVYAAAMAADRQPRARAS